MNKNIADKVQSIQTNAFSLYNFYVKNNILILSLCKFRYNCIEVSTMNFFKKNKKEHIIIVGCGRFGAGIVETLTELNKSISVIDIDENAFTKLPLSLNLLSVIGDGADYDILALAGAKDADILIASTNDDNINIMIAQIAKQIYHIQTVIIRIYDISKYNSFKNMDIISICPAMLSANECCKIVLAKENMKI